MRLKSCPTWACVAVLIVSGLRSALMIAAGPLKLPLRVRASQKVV